MSIYKQMTTLARLPGLTSVGKTNRRPILSKKEAAELVSGPVLIEEKLDGTTEAFEVFIGRDRVVLFHEDLTWQHTVAYTKIPPASQHRRRNFQVIFDIWLIGENRWADRIEKEVLADEFGWPVVPLVFAGETTLDQLPNLANRPSAFGETRAEGIVIKNYARGRFAKIVTSEFIERVEDAEHWRRAPRVPNQLAHPITS